MLIIIHFGIKIKTKKKITYSKRTSKVRFESPHSDNHLKFTQKKNKLKKDFKKFLINLIDQRTFFKIKL